MPEGIKNRPMSVSLESKTSGDPFLVSLGHFRYRTSVKPSACSSSFATYCGAMQVIGYSYKVSLVVSGGASALARLGHTQTVRLSPPALRPVLRTRDGGDSEPVRSQGVWRDDVGGSPGSCRITLDDSGALDLPCICRTL